MREQTEGRQKRTAGRTRGGARQCEGGMVLFVGLLAITVLSVVGVALAGLSLNENQATRSQRDAVQATYLADLAVERAKSELNKRLDAAPSKMDFDAELTANGGYLFGAASGPSAYVTFTVGAQTSGIYRLRLTNNADGGTPTDDRDKVVIATAEGVVKLRGHTRTKRVEAVLGPGLPGQHALGDCPGGWLPVQPTLQLLAMEQVVRGRLEPESVGLMDGNDESLADHHQRSDLRMHS